jgi:hypothetical protein
VLRLFKRGCGRFTEALVHESVVVEGNTVKLCHPLLHYSYIDAGDVERKIAQYSDAAARQMFEQGKRSGWVGATLSGGWAFVRTYIIRLGVLDGVAGWGIACMNARTTYLKYRKLAGLYASVHS